MPQSINFTKCGSLTTPACVGASRTIMSFRPPLINCYIKETTLINYSPCI